MARQVKSGGALSAYAFDKTKSYKWNTAGVVVESIGTPGINELTINGSASALRRIADIERNISIMYTRAFTTDYQGSVSQLGTDPISWNESENSVTSMAYQTADQAGQDAQNADSAAQQAQQTADDADNRSMSNEQYIMAWDQAGLTGSIVQVGVNTTTIAANAAAIATNTTSIANLLTNTDATSLNSLAEVVAAFQAADSTVNGAITALSVTAATDRAAIRTELAGAITVAESDWEAYTDDAVDYQTPGTALFDYNTQVQNDIASAESSAISIAGTAAEASTTSVAYVLAQNAELSAQSALILAGTAENRSISNEAFILGLGSFNSSDVSQIAQNQGDIQNLQSDVANADLTANDALNRGFANEQFIQTNISDIAANGIAIAANTAAIAANTTSAKVHFHSAPVDTTLDGSGNVETTYTFAELSTAEHYVVYVNRMLLRASEYAVVGSDVVASASVLSIGDELEVVGFS
jgi:hypothetical protein